MNQLLLPSPIKHSASIKPPAETDYIFPSVSIFLPFNPKMKSKASIAKTLQSAVDKVERELFDGISFEMALVVMYKLKAILKNLNFSSHKKSLAIFVSPVFEKVFYLNTEIEEKILIGSSFHIRDLVRSKKQLHEYLVLKITDTECRIYANQSGELETIFLYRMGIGWNELEVTAEKFLQRIDNTLQFILESHNLPLFVLGNKSLINHFREITKHTSPIIEFIPIENEYITSDDIKNTLTPYLRDWQKIKQKLITSQLRDATKNCSLAAGMHNVFRTAEKTSGRILLVEEDYTYPSESINNEQLIFKATQPYSRYSYIKDAVDEVIEKILDKDGDVEFVNKRMVEKHGNIALLL